MAQRLISSFFVVLLFCKCKYDKVENLTISCDTTNVTFYGSIKPILETKCYSCHQGSNPSAGINLQNEAIVSSNAELILKTVRYDSDVIGMPIGEKLPECQIKKIEIWFKKGGTIN
jgi:hypothetical protein